MVYAGLIVLIAMIIGCVSLNLYVGYALIIGLVLFFIISALKGNRPGATLRMALAGSKKSFSVLRILFLIGMVISVWMASGTIPTIVYYCLQFMRPETFILSAFIASLLVSSLIGTSLGTVSAMGVPLMIIATSSGLDPNIVGGAIIAGAYVGDRWSPMSSSAALVSSVTGTNLFTNIKNMVRTAILPLLITLGGYWLLSGAQPVHQVENSLSSSLTAEFQIGWVMLIPALIILVLCLFKVKLFISIPVSLAAAILIGMLFQGRGLFELLRIALLGFKLDGGPLESIISGGGVVSMLKTAFNVFVSCCLLGIFNGLHLLDPLDRKLTQMNLSGARLFGVTCLIGILTAALGCNQTVAVIMTAEIMKNCYKDQPPEVLALHLENSVILLSPLIPWNAAAMSPTTVMQIGMAQYIPYCFYPFAVPLFCLMVEVIRDLRKGRRPAPAKP